MFLVGYKLVIVDDQFSKSFMLYLGEDGGCKFIKRMVKERKYCSCVWWKNILIRKMPWLKKMMKISTKSKSSKSYTKCWICDDTSVDGDVKVKNQCHTAGKYGGSAHRDCNIKVRSNL